MTILSLKISANATFVSTYMSLNQNWLKPRSLTIYLRSKAAWFGFPCNVRKATEATIVAANFKLGSIVYSCVVIVNHRHRMECFQ